MTVPSWVTAFLASTVGKVVKRVVVTAAVTFVTVAGGLAVSSGLFTPAHVTDLSLWSKAAVGGETAAVAAALSLVQSLVSQFIAGLPSISGTAHVLAARRAKLPPGTYEASLHLTCLCASCERDR